ncbi:MAG: ureidoglycolate lyase [Dehalococcoidales bacterium]
MSKKVKVKQLTCEAFQPYGSFANMVKPTGPKLGKGFFRDIVILNLGQASQAAFSVMRVEKREKIINAMECHQHTGEGCMPLDGDILIHVAPASYPQSVPLDQIEVFRVPKGTLVVMRPGVWHCAPFADKADAVNVMVVLPERTYANDMFFYKMTREEEIQIEESELSGEQT